MLATGRWSSILADEAWRKSGSRGMAGRQRVLELRRDGGGSGRIGRSGRRSRRIGRAPASYL
jgi:hypothetical protein